MAIKREVHTATKKITVTHTKNLMRLLMQGDNDISLFSVSEKEFYELWCAMAAVADELGWSGPSD